MGVHLVILACNTASAKALRTIQQRDLPRYDATRRVLGVVRPSAEQTVNVTQNRHIGILGTTGTVQSMSYILEIRKFLPDAVVTQQACPMWVPLVENNESDSEGADFFVRRDLNLLFSRDSKIDTLILGCTHYPLLMPLIQKYTPEHVKVLSQGKIVSASLKDYLLRHPEIDKKCTKNGTCRFFTTESPEKFDEAASVFLDFPVKSQRLHF
jgi:glutamate racemase